MDHDSKKTIRLQLSPITIKLVTETESTGSLKSDTEKTRIEKTYAVEAMTIESEEVRSIHGDPLPDNYSDPSVDQFLEMLDNPAAQKAIGTLVQAFMTGAPIPSGSDPRSN